MRSGAIKRIVLASQLVTFCTFVVLSCGSHEGSRGDQFPDVTVWAWDTPNDLRFLAASKESVALYAGTVFLGEDTAYFKPNSKPFEVSPSTRVFPAFRIESRGKVSTSEMNAQTEKVLQIIMDNMNEHKQINAPAVQIDFDAATSERDFYRAFLKKLRHKLGPQTRISVTALASWCLGDRWLSHNNVDEAVVMLFSMGASEGEIFEHVSRGELSAGKDIDLAIGLSANEHRTNAILLKYKDLFRGRHLYFFNSLQWTEKSLRQAEKNLCIENQNL